MTVNNYGIWNTMGGQSTVAHSSSDAATILAGHYHPQAAQNPYAGSSVGFDYLQQAQAYQQALQSSMQAAQQQAAANFFNTVTVTSTSTTGVVGINPYTQPPAYITAPSTEAVHRSMELLYDWMNPEQRKQWATRNYFDVIGGDSGRRYRIYPPMPFNIHRLAKDSDEPDWKICFEPKDKKLPKGDILLCQKLALELDERDTLEIANQQVYHAW